MTSRRARTRAQEQQLLGVPADSALGQLLADASAPAQPHELHGLSAALTAFSTHSPGPRRSPVQSVLAKLLAAKVLATTASAAAVGGIALAASAGALPAPAQNAAHDLVGAPAASHPTHPSETVAQEPKVTPKPSATPSPSLVGLCRAYGAGVATSHGKALDNPAFTVLVTAAGGKDAVTGYCAKVLAAAPGGRPTALPTQAQGHKPVYPPGTHPTGKPSPHPTGKPTSHPTGRP
jgi:hypothetical protein